MDILLLVIQKTAVVWVPLLLGVICYRIITTYKQQYFVNNKIKYVMLELHIPREIHRSPQAMEFVIDVLHHLGGGAMSWKDRLWYGASLYPSSLEIVSIEGNIYFFIRADKKLIDLLKSTLYSQYPKVEINEVDDYTRYVPDYNTHQDSWYLYGAEYTLAKPQHIPLKTYVDYELDKNIGSLEENQKIDPITPMLEYLSTLRAGEQIWIQYIIRADVFSNWRKEAADYIQEIMGRGGAIPDDGPFQTVKLTHGEQEMVKGIERSLSKFAFESVIRCLYIAQNSHVDQGRKGYFKGPIFKPFSSLYYNSLKRSEDTGFDWIWEDITGKRAAAQQRRFFNDFVNRTAFYKPFWVDWNPFWNSKKETTILTSEELATLFHLPGRVSETSSVDRIEATKAEPPTNLPL